MTTENLNSTITIVVGISDAEGGIHASRAEIPMTMQLMDNKTLQQIDLPGIYCMVGEKATEAFNRVLNQLPDPLEELKEQQQKDQTAA